MSQMVLDRGSTLELPMGISYGSRQRLHTGVNLWGCIKWFSAEAPHLSYLWGSHMVLDRGSTLESPMGMYKMVLERGSTLEPPMGDVSILETGSTLEPTLKKCQSY
jgi:hypothetical protein